MRKLLMVMLGLILAARCSPRRRRQSRPIRCWKNARWRWRRNCAAWCARTRPSPISHAELAVDLKNQIREKLKAGMNEAQIIDYMVARYGDFVLYRPPVKASTLPLWIGPVCIAVRGGRRIVLLHRAPAAFNAGAAAERGGAGARALAARCAGGAPMTLFWVCAALLAGVALAFLLTPLLRSRAGPSRRYRARHPI